jgi:hypothetical protein
MADSVTNAPAGITKRGAAPPIQKVFDIAPEREGRRLDLGNLVFRLRCSSGQMDFGLDQQWTDDLNTEFRGESHGVDISPTGNHAQCLLDAARCTNTQETER